MVRLRGECEYFFSAKTGQEARAFLDTKSVFRKQNYIFVETPEGNWVKTLTGSIRNNDTLQGRTIPDPLLLPDLRIVKIPRYWFLKLSRPVSHKILELIFEGHLFALHISNEVKTKS
jgi:hypothetical protein